jgi:transcriptional regulator with XRE-family HTH domain
MDFHEKLQTLRKQRGLTQEELAASLYVSRTAISKWESGRGYPNIDSLKALAAFYSVSLDELLSTNEILSIAEEDNRQKTHRLCNLMCGLLDLCASLLFFLPLFADRSDGIARATTLFALETVQPYMKVLYVLVILALSVWGILTAVLRDCRTKGVETAKKTVSLCIGVAAVLLFILGLQPYAAVFAFVLLAVKLPICRKRA